MSNSALDLMDKARDEITRLIQERDPWKEVAQREANNAKYWREAHDEVCEGFFQIQSQYKAAQTKLNHYFLFWRVYG